MCLKRKQKIDGYKYEICIWDKVTKTIQNSTREQEVQGNNEAPKDENPETEKEIKTTALDS